MLVRLLDESLPTNAFILGFKNRADLRLPTDALELIEALEPS